MLRQKVPGSSSSRKLLLSIGSAVGPDDGGRQRSEQLRELGLLRNAELMSVDEPGDSADTRGDFFVAIRFGKAFFRVLPLLSMRGIVSALRQCGKMLGIVQRHSFERLLIEMGAGRNLLPAFFLSHLGLPIEVFPHNIEFLSLKPQDGIFRSATSAQKIELDVYRRANKVWTISDFDTAVLQSMGLSNVETLPYYPTSEKRMEFHEIKNKRALCSKGGFLILGSATNEPTLIGMRHLLRLLRKYKGEELFRLAGNGTEVLTDEAPKCVEVLGTLSGKKLRSELVSCAGILIYQPSTSGLLTRIIDAQMAGIPVFVFENYLQARLIGYPNVYIISSLNELPVPPYDY